MGFKAEAAVFIMILVFAGLALALEEVPSCTDSDGGLDYYKKGSVSAGNVYAEDSCSGDTLLEFACSSNGTYTTSLHYCGLNGCKDGACDYAASLSPSLKQAIGQKCTDAQQCLSGSCSMGLCKEKSFWEKFKSFFGF